MIEQVLHSLGEWSSRHRLATSLAMFPVSLVLLAHSLGWVAISVPLWATIAFAFLAAAWAIVLGRQLWRELADADLSED